MSKTLIIAEIGINHNGDVNIAKKLIAMAKESGCDLVKFQKRTIEKVYSKEQLETKRESPWGTTNYDQKKGLEFTKEQYDEIDRYCKEIGIDWFASAWDLESVEFLKQYNLKYNKIASALLGQLDLLKAVAQQGKYTFISTGMNTLPEIERAVDIFRQENCPFELMHCNSQYPLPMEDTNLKCIETLREKFKCKVGYSCHSSGIIFGVLSVALGATSVEKHITLDRAMYGSDQAASLESPGLKKMVEYIRAAEVSLGDGVKTITKGEIKVREKLYKTKDY